MRTAWKVSVDLVIEAVNQAEVADAVSAILSERCQVIVDDTTSSLVDWQYQPDDKGVYFRPVRLQIPDREDTVEGDVFGNTDLY